MSKKIKMIALDIDGTLVDHGQTDVSPRLIQAAEAAKKEGIEVVIATGRHRSTSEKIACALSANQIITLNGGEIWTVRGELLLRQAIRNEDATSIINKLSALNSHYWLVSDQGVFEQQCPEDFHAHTWIKFVCDLAGADLKQEVLQYFSSYDHLEMTNSSETNIEINRRGTHKRQAIEYLLSTRDFGFDQVMAMGDSLNDLLMIKSAGFGVAMGNAQEVVKQAAQFVTKRFDEDGAAIAIEKMLLDNKERL